MEPRTLSELEALSRAELVNLHDSRLSGQVLSLNYLAQAINYHDQKIATAETLKLARHVRCLTVIVTVLTVATVVLMWLSLRSQGAP